MAAHPAYSLLWHLTLQYRLHSQICQNGFYFSNKIALNDQEAFIESTPITLANHFAQWMLPLIIAFQNTEVLYDGIVVVTLIPHEGQVAERPIANQTGAQPDESLPGYCSAILSLRTGLSGKSNRGRLYFSGVSEGDAAAGRLTPSGFTALSDIGNELQSLYGLSGSEGHYQHVIFSKKLGYSNGIYSTAGIRPIQSYIPRSVLGSQRHRLIGHGT